MRPSSASTPDPEHHRTTPIRHHAGLQDQGTPAGPQSQPSCRLRGVGVELPGAGDNKSGVRECGLGRFARPLHNAEVMHIRAGVCSFTPTGGEALQIRQSPR